MTKQEIKIVLKLIDNHTDEHEYSPCFSTKQISEEGIKKLKKDIIDLFDDCSLTKGDKK